MEETRQPWGIFSGLIAGFCASQSRDKLVLGTLSASSIHPKHVVTLHEALQSNFSFCRNKSGLTEMTRFHQKEILRGQERSCISCPSLCTQIIKEITFTIKKGRLHLQPKKSTLKEGSEPGWIVFVVSCVRRGDRCNGQGRLCCLAQEDKQEASARRSFSAWLCKSSSRRTQLKHKL